MATKHKLSEHIKPTHYDLNFEPDLKKFTFRGKETIQIQIKKATSKITLNSRELKITKAQIKIKKEILKPKTSSNTKSETITLSLDKKINPSKISLDLEFQGVLNDDLSGFYRSKYYDKKGKEKYLATTQFEAPYARQAFPCFDEPGKKATFNVSLLIDKKHKAISNMPIKSEKKIKSKKLISFEKTPLMSTYLLYMGLGDFEFLESKHNKVKLRIVTIPGKSKQGAFALELTKKFLKYFESYSGIKYPLPKLDLIAIPDFSAGAMENWGAITFREVLLLFDKKKSSTRIKKRIGEVIAHELWHQWSGNLVTMKWWDDLWLNESFATYMAFKALAHYFPEWRVWEDFIETETSGAFAADSLKTTHPIAVKVKSANEIEEIFDEISYGKGGSVLRMIEGYLGEKEFRSGVSKYLKKYKYENAEASDLWDNLSKVSKKPIKKVMESWIKQKGYPILDTKEQNSNLILTQQAFNKTKNQSWLVPLVINSNKKIIKSLLTKKTDKIKITSKNIKINHLQEGFYRTNYSNKQLKNIKTIILNKKISAIDRWGIQNDLFSLCLHGEIPITEYLNFIKSYKRENSYFVLADIYSNIYQIYYTFSENPEWKEIWPQFKNHIREPFQRSFSRLGWEPKKKENINDSLLRPLAISYLSFAEDKKIIKQGLKKLNSKLHPDIKGAVYNLTASNSPASYKKLLKKYLTTKDEEEKIKLLASLYKTKDKKLLSHSLKLALSDKIRTQNLRTVFAIISSNPLYKPLLFQWIKSNWPTLKKYEKTHFVFMGLLETLITSYTGNKNKKQISTFLKSKKIKYEKTKANSFETLDINTTWLEKNKKSLYDYFKNK